MEKLQAIVDTVNTYLSDYILVVLLVVAGLFFTVKTRFVQVRCFGEGMKRVFGKISLKGGKQEGGLSSFQALATAVAAQVGTGNIVGACGAILVGGPGAIFWMWVIAFLGMATIYAEAVLAQKTRVVQADGTVLGGPVYYIKQAFKGKFGKFLAGFFAVAIIIALGFLGCMVQSNSIGGAIKNVIDPNNAYMLNICGTEVSVVLLVVGVVLVIASAFIFLGGVQRIASVTEKLVPLMAVLFIAGGLVILCVRWQSILPTFGLIFKSAFAPQAIVGGTAGAAIKAAISQGAKRGLFSNEAGMGSTPHAHAMAKVEKPHDQGVVAMIGVFIDTFVVLTMTALVVISTMYVNGEFSGLVGNGFAEAVTEMGIDKNNLMQIAFSTVTGNTFGYAFVAICLLFFAFSTIVGWNLFGKINMEYLFGKKSLPIYSVVALIFIFLGALLSNDLVWGLMDMFNYLMVLPNVVALIALSSVVSKTAREKRTKK